MLVTSVLPMYFSERLVFPCYMWRLGRKSAKTLCVAPVGKSHDEFRARTFSAGSVHASSRRDS